MTVAELLDRAYSARALPIGYRLGSGAPPSHPTPAGEDGFCDCSGFVAWAFGYARHQPNFGFLVKLNGGWMNTDGIVEDSLNKTGLFEPCFVSATNYRPSMVLVYPSLGYAKRAGFETLGSSPQIGHVGIVTRVRKSGLRVLHCSAGNVRKFGWAIEETNADVFMAVSYTRPVIFGGIA